MSEPKKKIKIFGYWAGDWEAGISASEVSISIEPSFETAEEFTRELRDEALKKAEELLEILLGEPPDNGMHFEDECITCRGVEEHIKGCPDQEPEPMEL